MRALFTAATGMNAQQTRLDAISNNLANVNTTGFKRGRADFQDLFYETLRTPGAMSAAGNVIPTGVQIGSGVRLASVSRHFSQGDALRTDGQLDLAVQGDGFFQVTKPDGETVYTRDGSFKLDQDGNIVTNEGFQMIPNITIPTDALLRGIGANFFTETEASGSAELGIPDESGFGEIAQGFLESSNVNVAEELVSMILAQRAFEMNSRVIQAGDEMMQVVGALSR